MIYINFTIIFIPYRWKLSSWDPHASARLVSLWMALLVQVASSAVTWWHATYGCHALQGSNISHLGKRKIIFKSALGGDMLVSSLACEPTNYIWCIIKVIKNKSWEDFRTGRYWFGMKAVLSMQIFWPSNPPAGQNSSGAEEDIHRLVEFGHKIRAHYLGLWWGLCWIHPFCPCICHRNVFVAQFQNFC